MSTFACPVVRVEIAPHPNADAIELARVGGYVSIVKKGQFRTGDLAVYIPEQAVLPEWLLKDMGFWDELNTKGTLSGSAGNRVKAIKLRGVLSQGLLLSVNEDECQDGSVLVSVTSRGDDGENVWHRVAESNDAASYLGITKYEPKVPVHMAGKVAGGDLDATIAYDFENLKRHPDIFEDGMPVVITEKIHGTLLQVGLVPQRLWEGKSWAEKCPLIGDRGFRGVVTSKGQGARGLLLDPADVTNLYVGMVNELQLWERLLEIADHLGHPSDMPIYLLGEIFGEGVQDLGYRSAKTFRAFDIYCGTRDNGFFVNASRMINALHAAAIEMVPLLHIGPYDHAEVLRLTDGKTTICADGHIREGVVVKAVEEDPHPRLGRRIAKSISEHYLLRKNATEFQ